MTARPDTSLSFLIDGSQVEAERLRFPALKADSATVNTASGKKGDYVLVWMQKAQRSRDNPALELGFHIANRLRLPLFVLFVLVDYPHALHPHYRFMLEGLKQCAQDLRDRGALFCMEAGAMVPTVARYARRAAVLIADEGKLAFERAWRTKIAELRALPPMILVETESVVPPYAASDHLEWSAATLRRKISAKLPFFLRIPQTLPECRYPARAMDIPSRDELFNSLPSPSRPSLPDSATGSAPGRFIGLQKSSLSPGWSAGMARFAEFLDSGGLDRYEIDRNNPCVHGQSEMSPYLHFGQVSPIALASLALGYSENAAQCYIEQLVVRRELALNFVLFNPDYDHYESAVPDWARRSLLKQYDRKSLYTATELEKGDTEDRFWNAAQKELILTGKMHNYLRMYWGKQLLSWFPNPAEAFDLALCLNDSYSLDGRDLNGYAGVAWCFGRHDRPWPTRPQYGAVRSMAVSGLKKKFDADRYASEVEDLYNRRIKEIS